MDFFEEEPKQRYTARSQPGGLQSVLARRAIAVGVFLLIFLLVVLGIRGCLDARRDRAIKNYSGDAAGLVNESDAIGNDFFTLLEKPGNAAPLDLENRINSFRASSDQLVTRAQKLSTPDELKDANRWLTATLEFRRDALAEIARLMTSANGKKNSQAVDKIAGQMQAFLASDVIYLQRFVPQATDVLNKRKLSDEVKIPQKRFLTDVSWLMPDTVAQRVSGLDSNKASTPGLHGVGLTSVTVEPDGTELNENQTTNVKTSSKLAFTVAIQDQGENDESGVKVQLKVGNTDLQKNIPKIAAGQSQSVTIPLSAKAPVGATTVAVKVGPVPGEKLTDNNQATYPVVFQR